MWAAWLVSPSGDDARSPLDGPWFLTIMQLTGEGVPPPSLMATTDRVTSNKVSALRTLARGDRAAT